jgi:hypothetical protein
LELHTREEKGIDYEVVDASPHSPEVNAIHPFGKLPVMRHGAFTLCESKAIATYLDRGFPGPALMPSDPREAALAEQWISLVNTNQMRVSAWPAWLSWGRIGATVLKRGLVKLGGFPDDFQCLTWIFGLHVIFRRRHVDAGP